MTVHTVCTCPEGVQIRGFIGMRVMGCEVSESQIRDLELTVVWRSSVSAEYENIVWLDVLMPTEEIPISELHIQAAKYLPVQNLGCRSIIASSAVYTLETVQSMHQPIREHKNIFSAFWFWCAFHECIEISPVRILQDEIVGRAMDERTIEGDDVWRWTASPPKLYINIALDLLVAFRLVPSICFKNKRIGIGIGIWRGLLRISKLHHRHREGQRITWPTLGCKELYASSTTILKIIALPPFPISVLLRIGRITSGLNRSFMSY